VDEDVGDRWVVGVGPGAHDHPLTLAGLRSGFEPNQQPVSQVRAR
jgi:hypothetical protein